MMKKSRVIIIIPVIVIIMIGLIVLIKNRNTSHDILIEECLVKLYTITDSNELDKYYEVFYKVVASNNPEDKEKLLFGYQEICSDNGIDSIMSNRLHTLYRDAARIAQFTMKVNDIEYRKVLVVEGDGSILKPNNKLCYEYTVELILEYVDSGEEITIFEEGYINLIEIKNEWKVDLLTFKLLNEVFKELVM
jgi:hypothetical protein